MPFPLEEKYIKETEAYFSVQFPESFRQKMMLSNGGEISIDDDDWLLHPFLDKTDNKRISRTCNDIIKESISAKEWKDFPKNSISIGQNGYGDHIIFIKELNSINLNPFVYCWKHETGELIKIAEDFSELLN